MGRAWIWRTVMTSGVDADMISAVGHASSDGTELDALRMLCYADSVFAARYEGWDELGRGAHATVVRTYQRDAGVAVALKVWWRLADSDSRQLRAEAQALMRIVHPCVVRTFAVFDRGPLAWIELELIDGPTLREELRARSARNEPMPAADALEIGACLAEGLAAVHAAGFVHRDVKPGNVLLPRGGQPAAKLTDFGIAHAIDATVVLGDAMRVSMKYISPEALQGHTPGTAGDVYALCVTLYQLFSGGLYPFALREEAPVAEILDCHRRRAPIPLRALGLDLPDEVVDVIQHGLAKQARRRPSAAEVAFTLRAVQRRGSGVVLPRRRERRMRRAVRVLMALAGLGLAVVLGLVMVWMLLHG